MRSKHILHAAAFITAFGLSAAFASLFIPKVETVSTYTTINYQPTSCFKYKNSSAVATKITAFINQDKRNGHENGVVRYEGDESIFISPDGSALRDYAFNVEEYLAASNELQATGLPADFQIKWREHMKTWRDYSEFLNRMKKPSNRVALNDEELQAIDDFHSREIERTWKEILRNGRSHSANIY